MRKLEEKFLELPEVIEMLKELYPENKNISNGVLPISIVDTEKWARDRVCRYRTALIELSGVEKMVEKYQQDTTSDAERIFLEYIFDSIYSSIDDISEL